MSENAGDSAAGGDLVVIRDGALVRVVLRRAKALNALTTDMRATFASAIPKLARDASLYAVAILSENPKAFCSGGDVRELISWNKTEPERARRALADEYRLNWTLDCFSKPTMSLVNGMVMGSGVGITLYNTHRVAGEKYSFAMPETAIGLFPDVGVAHVLARLPDEVGTYLGLTGRSIGRADAYHLGLATHSIDSSHFPGILTALADAQTIDALLDGLDRDPGPGELDPVRAVIGHCFAAATVEGIVDRLRAVAGPDQTFAEGVLEDLARRSPTSLKVTLRHLRQARKESLREVLDRDYRLAWRCLDGHDFAEGVRAALIDKDNHPVWQPATLAGVTDAMVAAHFAPLAERDELRLASREDMQASRI